MMRWGNDWHASVRTPPQQQWRRMHQPVLQLYMAYRHEYLLVKTRHHGVPTHTRRAMSNCRNTTYMCHVQPTTGFGIGGDIHQSIYRMLQRQNSDPFLFCTRRRRHIECWLTFARESKVSIIFLYRKNGWSEVKPKYILTMDNLWYRQ